MTKDKDKDNLDARFDKIISGVKDEKVNKFAADSNEIKSSPDSIELSDADKLRLEAEAAKEVAEELKAEKSKQFKAEAKARLKKQKLFQAGKDEIGDDTETVLISLAPHAPFIRLDNNIFYPNRMYRLGKKTAQTIKDIMFQTWRHDHELSGQNMNAFYGKQARNAVLSPNGIN